MHDVNININNITISNSTVVINKNKNNGSSLISKIFAIIKAIFVTFIYL